MFERASVKQKGKESFKSSYWYSVIAAFIFNLFFVSTSSVTYSKKDEILSEGDFAGLDASEALIVLLVVLGIISTIMLVMFLVKLFLLNPLKVGCDRFFLSNQDQNAPLSELGFAFKNNYISSALGLFLSDILIGIGFALFFIPGCILSYSYRMVPYILADEPGIGAIEALKRSRHMMQGNKWAAFVFDLSFIGWYILSIFTLGLLSFFYVNPYKYNANAALYKAIKR